MNAARLAVIKLSGKILDEPQALGALAKDIAMAQAAGMRIVIVHGGGKQLDRLSVKLGLSPLMIAGRRVTDAATLSAAKMAFAGELLTDLLVTLAQNGLKPVGLHGPACILARKRPPVVTPGYSEPIDYGHVGDVTSVDTDLLETLLAKGYVPVIAPLAGDREGQLFNINADTIAGEVAAALQADLALLLSDVPGVLNNPQDPESIIETLDAQLAAKLECEGVLSGGMLPKISAVMKIAKRSTGDVRVASGFASHIVCRALGLVDGQAGTRILA